jgi:hypothetical protein
MVSKVAFDNLRESADKNVLVFFSPPPISNCLWLQSAALVGHFPTTMVTSYFSGPIGCSVLCMRFKILC